MQGIKTLVSRVSLRSAVSMPSHAQSQHRFNTQRQTHASAGGDSLNVRSQLDSSLQTLHLPELPETPRYPCPFLSTAEIEKYLVPLYRRGWGITHTQPPSDTTKPRAPATRLSKRIVFPNTDISGIFMTDVVNHVTAPENHHPAWEVDTSHTGGSDVHIHTHSALAPLGRQNADDRTVSKKGRPGITLRDIRWALLFEELLQDYIRQGLLKHHSHAPFAQPVDLDAVHNFLALPPQP